MTRRKRLMVLGAAAVALVLGGLGQAFACVSLSTLELSTPSGPAGTRVTVTGTGYRVPGGDPVVLRWNGTDGRELARATPDAGGGIRASFTVPDGAAGFYVVVAVQRDSRGVDAYGTPSRASFEVVPTVSPSPPKADGALPVAASSVESDRLAETPVTVAALALVAVAFALARRQTSSNAGG